MSVWSCVTGSGAERLWGSEGEWRSEPGQLNFMVVILFPSVDLTCSQKVCVMTESNIILHPLAYPILDNKGTLPTL